MKRYQYLLCLAGLLQLSQVAQLAAQPVFDIAADTSMSITIRDEYLLYWPDSGGSTSFKEVSGGGESGRFKPIGAADSLDASIRTHWYSFQLRNDMDKDIQMGIQWWGSYFDIYYADSTETWTHLKNGSAYSRADRDGYKLLRLVDFTLPAKRQITVYLRYQNLFRFDPPKEIELLLMGEALEKRFGIRSRLSEFSSTEIMLMSFLLGMILVSSIINFTFFQAIREKEYLYFVLFLLCLAATNLVGFFGTFFLDRSSEWTVLVNFIANLFLFFFLMRFVQYFFKTKQYLPKWNMFLDIYNYLLVFVWIFGFFFGTNRISIGNQNWVADILGFLVYFFMDVLFVTVCLFLFKKEGQVKSRLLAIIPLLFVFGPLFSLQFVFGLAERYLGVAPPAFIALISGLSSLFIVVGVFWVILFFSWLLFKRYQGIQQQIINEQVSKEKLEREKEAEKNLLIAQQNERLEREVAQRTNALRQSLDTLKATQSQLIQAEKMASLGELTAGIAHEIQNPLNFVNNFSEVNSELVAELEEAVRSGQLDQALEIAGDIRSNEDKIRHHGLRADGIVKGMLQHSRRGAGIKEPTNINLLADEYLRLAYHGLRAKDKSFNARFETQLDDSLPPVNVDPQEIGRVLLNLINNAFYAVSERQRTGEPDYEPTVTVRTRQADTGIEIALQDNGHGIPEAIRDKIFQPFFTTKPTGQGTGLGLSLSYDIVTQGHGGKLNVVTEEGKGTTFIIWLPAGQGD